MELTGVSFVGASGSSKSTVTVLLQCLHESDSGSISVGNNNIRAMDVNHLWQHVTVISNLFDATISENISYGKTTGPPMSMTSRQRRERMRLMKEHQPIHIVASCSTSTSLCLLWPTCCLRLHLSVLMSNCRGTILCLFTTTMQPILIP
jgi:ABC-type cobalamin/Fe3+-siderophores transport system ATPase subunit